MSAPLVTPTVVRNPRRENLDFVLFGLSGSFLELKIDTFFRENYPKVYQMGGARYKDGGLGGRCYLVVKKWSAGALRQTKKCPFLGLGRLEI